MTLIVEPSPPAQDLPDLSNLILPPGWQTLYGDPKNQDRDFPANPSPLYRGLFKLLYSQSPGIILHLDTRSSDPDQRHCTIKVPRLIPPDETKISARLRQPQATYQVAVIPMAEFNRRFPYCPNNNRPPDYWLNDFLESQLQAAD